MWTRTHPHKHTHTFPVSLFETDSWSDVKTQRHYSILCSIWNERALCKWLYIHTFFSLSSSSFGSQSPPGAQDFDFN